MMLNGKEERTFFKNLYMTTNKIKSKHILFKVDNVYLEDKREEAIYHDYHLYI